MITDLELMEQWIKARFPLGDDERLDPQGSSTTPAFILMRTRLGCIWRFRADLAPDLVRGIAKLAGREPPLAVGVADAPPPERLEPMTRILEEGGVVSRVTREALPDPEPIADVFFFWSDQEDRIQAPTPRFPSGSVG